jgi:uncharacterized membrane protein
MSIERRALLPALAAGVLAATAVVGSGTAAADTAAAATCEWTAQGLPTPPGTVYSWVRASDGRGRFAGDVTGPDFGTHPAVWRDGRVTDLGTPFGLSASARDVDRHGDVVGSASDPTRNGADRAFLYTGGRYVPLAEPAGVMSSVATGLDGKGTIVGWAYTSDYRAIGLVWSLRRPDQVAVIPSGGVSLQVNGITDSGVVVGMTGTPTVDEAAVTWTPRTGIRRLPVDPDVQTSIAVAGAGRYIVGSWYAPSDGQSRGIVWVDGQPQPLQLLPTINLPTAVNADGLSASDGFGTAIVWPTPTSAPVALPPLGAVDAFAGAYAVTDDGRVAGSSRDAANVVTATVWTCH